VNGFGSKFDTHATVDVVLQPGALTFKTIGGIVDLFVMVGPSPYDVVDQYTQIIGRPHFPPYWGLGFVRILCLFMYVRKSFIIQSHQQHQCRWGYQTVRYLLAFE